MVVTAGDRKAGQAAFKPKVNAWTGTSEVGRSSRKGGHMANVSRHADCVSSTPACKTCSRSRADPCRAALRSGRAAPTATPVHARASVGRLTYRDEAMPDMMFTDAELAERQRSAFVTTHRRRPRSTSAPRCEDGHIWANLPETRQSRHITLPPQVPICSPVESAAKGSVCPLPG